MKKYMYTSSRPYPYLAPGRTFQYVSEADPSMRAARTVCETHSTDRRHPTGSAILKDGVLLARAANLSGFRNPALIRLHEQGWCVRKALGIPSGKHYWLCPGCASHRNHSEALAIADARRRGVDIARADLYLWGHWWCCKPCWDAITRAEIERVYLVDGATERFGE